MLSVTLRVHEGEMLVAQPAAHCHAGKNWNTLMKNIKDVIEAYFKYPVGRFREDMS